MSRSNHVARRAPLTGVIALLLAPALAAASDAPQPFLAPHDGASFARALQCLTEAVYHEARSEAAEGQRAVAQVVLNRVRHPAYPNSVCGVVYQGSHRRTGCQFTFTCDGSLGRPIDPRAWSHAEAIADAALRGSVYHPVGLALNYHTTAIRPYWAPSLIRHAVIGAHIFYLRPGSGSSAAFGQFPAAVEPHIGYASAAPLRPAPGVRVARGARDYQPARYEMPSIERSKVERPTVQQRPRVERPTIERPTFERAVFAPPVSSRVSRARQASARPQAPAQARPAPAAGPRTTIESGVRVSRGS